MYEDFNCLDLRERENLVLTKGQHLVTIDFYGAAVKLYYYNMDFVELYFHPVNRKLMRVSMASGEELNKYLRRIEIRDF